MKLIERIVLSVSSFCPALFLYLLTLNIFIEIENSLLSYVKILGMLSMMYILSNISLRIIEKRSVSDNALVVSIQPMESEIIPTYLGLFVIVLGLGSLVVQFQTIIILLIYLVWYLLMERTTYFNLLWLIKYRYYRVTDKNGNTYTLYSKKKDLKLYKESNFSELVRINNFTFLDKER
ncbi:hypothetical protein [Streptococcus orisratti]|uniref:hypothetical protein n=1 Tax=Streptococcus orisratti TaxID=114652 RepID=UPI003CFCF86E